jgi:hypothetical protein
MSTPAEKRGRSEAILGELAELGLMLARELATQARACEEPEQQVALVDAFHKTSRAVRLTLALDAKLDRDAAREARDAACDAETRARRAEGAVRAAPAEPTPRDARKARVRNLTRRLLWNESEGDVDEYDALMDDLDARLHEAALAADFEALPVETVARSIAADMGLSGEIVLSLREPPSPPRLSPTSSLATADTG